MRDLSRLSRPPWEATLTDGQHTIVLYFLVIAALALLAGLIRTVLTRVEVGSRYRPATVARLAIVSIALLSYAFVILEFVRGYTAVDGGWRPNGETVFTFAIRYMDWSVTVPLLTIELLAVCAVSGVAVRNLQRLAGLGAFFMIFAGFIGVFVVGGDDRGTILIWGAISSVFWIFTNVVLIWAVRRSIGSLTPQAGALLRSAAVLLLSGWVIYPVIFVVQAFSFGGQWTTIIQVALCVTDVLVKIGFGGLVHRVAKLRTAEDVRAGHDVHPEAIWISSEKVSDAGLPREVYLSPEAVVHPARTRPSAGAAVPDAEPDQPPDIPIDLG